MLYSVAVTTRLVCIPRCSVPLSFFFFLVLIVTIVSSKNDAALSHRAAADVARSPASSFQATWLMENFPRTRYPCISFVPYGSFTLKVRHIPIPFVWGHVSVMKICTNRLKMTLFYAILLKKKSKGWAMVL